LEFKEKIKNYRIENNLTQKVLAAKLGVSRTLIAETESGKIKGTMKFISKLSTLSGEPLTYWTDTETVKTYKTYEALDVLIDAMIDSGMIEQNGKIDERGRKLIISVIEKEVALKLKTK